MSPAPTNGKICYIELPAMDVEASEKFYSTVFGWPMRTRGDGSHAFDDTTGQVSGAFVKGRAASSAVGTLFYIMVDDVASTCNVIESNGGKIIQAIGGDSPEITARFLDPAGNVVGLYQQPS
ncbi:MAG TPA: VOC family protein [Gemmatimonadaceae bacterium]|nr:VOC family protein [Gemmatimonadaceae bacterium]